MRATSFWLTLGYSVSFTLGPSHVKFHLFNIHRRAALAGPGWEMKPKILGVSMQHRSKELWHMGTDLLPISLEEGRQGPALLRRGRGCPDPAGVGRASRAQEGGGAAAVTRRGGTAGAPAGRPGKRSGLWARSAPPEGRAPSGIRDRGWGHNGLPPWGRPPLPGPGEGRPPEARGERGRR